MKVAIIGAGQMGSGIAHAFAQYGYSVNLVDVSQEQLNKAEQAILNNTTRQVTKNILTTEEAQNARQRINYLSDIAEAVHDVNLAIEAASENLELKQAIFKQLDELCPSECLLATNTSSISITKIAAATQRPSAVIGMHFMNPVPVMQLVEIIRGYDTSDAVFDEIMDITKSLNKIPVAVSDYPGFISNRILMPMINEAIYALFQNVAGVEQIDTVMKLGMAHPMGPLELADFIGLDTCLSILNILHDGFGLPKYAPCPLLVNMVTANKLGRKTGEGFYKYTEGRKDKKVSASFI